MVLPRIGGGSATSRWPWRSDPRVSTAKARIRPLAFFFLPIVGGSCPLETPDGGEPPEGHHRGAQGTCGSGWWVSRPPQFTGLCFFSREIGWNFKTPTGLSIYLSKKRAPCLSAYLSISPKNGRLTFFAPPPPCICWFPEGRKVACWAWFYPS